MKTKITWHTMKIAKNNIFTAYTAKYGLSSDYAQMQDIEYSDPDVQGSLEQALAWANLQPGEVLLDIGVNNGFELKFIKRQYEKIWATFTIIGIDLVKEVLEKAAERFFEHTNIHFLHGDARLLGGMDVVSNRNIEIKDNTVDVVIALTSLQSSSFEDDLEDFIEKLLCKMNKNARMIIAVPDCHVAGGRMVRGQFNANSGSVDLHAAGVFSEKIKGILKKHGFISREVGEYFKFLVFSRN